MWCLLISLLCICNILSFCFFPPFYLDFTVWLVCSHQTFMWIKERKNSKFIACYIFGCWSTLSCGVLGVCVLGVNVNIQACKEVGKRSPLSVCLCYPLFSHAGHFSLFWWICSLNKTLETSYLLCAEWPTHFWHILLNCSVLFFKINQETLQTRWCSTVYLTLLITSQWQRLPSLSVHR